MLITFHDFAYQGYNSLINEALDPEQKKIVDSWPKTGNGEKISGHVIPKGQDRISIPLEDSTDKKDNSNIPHPAVNKHLKDNGFEVTDYKGGYAKDKHGRQVSIGKALNKTKAPSEVMNAFTSDPKRSGSTQKAKGLKVIISRHPHDVAGMSTGQGWSSCMDMSGGCNAHYLGRDVKAGTHVAYLVHHDDDKAEKPIARIALKPFKSEDGTHTVLRPESRSYGTSDSSFAKTVKGWTEKNFPVDQTKVYKKDPSVYHDSGDRYLAHPNMLALAKEAKLRAKAFSKTETNVTPEQISTGLKDTSPQVAVAAIKHPNATNEHIKEAMSHPDEKVRAAAVSHKKATAEDITKGLQDHDLEVRRGAIGNKNATKQHVKTALQDKDPEVISKALLTHPKHIEAKDLPRFTDPGMGYGIASMALDHPLTTAEHVDKALKNKDEFIRAKAADHPKLSRSGLTKVLKDPDPTVRSHGVMRHDTTEADRDHAMNDKKTIVRSAVVNHKDATESQLTKGMKDESNSVRTEAISNPNSTVKHVDMAMKDNFHAVRKIAARHPKATSEHITKALNDQDPNVRMAAMKNRNATSEHIHKGLDDSDENVRSVAMQNPNATSEHIARGLKDESNGVRFTAAKHPNATEKQKKSFVKV